MKEELNTDVSNQARMTSCDKCSKQPVIFIRYSGARLCKKHFCEFVEKRVRHELRRQMTLDGAERMAVALSGGKDSIVTAHLLKQILSGRRDMEFAAITIDEGIEGYRSSAIRIVAENCEALDMEHIVVSFEEAYGFKMDDVAEAERNMSTCTYCGVMRRTALNRAAKAWEATRLATGLNLDDTAQSILMNFTRGDMERLARLGPHRRVQEGLVPRIQPLRTIPESEATLYAMIRGIRHHDLECPYAPEALRNEYRSMLAQLEDKHPGTRHSILKSHDTVLKALERMYPPAAMRECECGEPTVSEKCKVCELVESLRREKINQRTPTETTHRSSCRRNP